MRLISLVTAIFMVVGVSAAQDQEPGPNVGDALPNSIETVDASGAARNFDNVKGANGAVIVFFRSADWCPYCQRQLIELNGIVSQVKAAGYELVGLSYDSAEKLGMFANRRSITFTLLSDEGSKVIDSFGLRNPTYPEGHYAHGVPHPTVLVVDADGIVTHKFFSDDYKVRPEKEVILSALSAE